MAFLYDENAFFGKFGTLHNLSLAQVKEVSEINDHCKSFCGDRSVIKANSDDVIPLVELDLFTLHELAVSLLLFFEIRHTDLGIRLNRRNDK